MNYPQRRNVTTSMVGLKNKQTNKQKTNKQTNKTKTVTYAKISPKMMNPRDMAGNAEEEEEELQTFL